MGHIEHPLWKQAGGLGSVGGPSGPQEKSPRRLRGCGGTKPPGAFPPLSAALLGKTRFFSASRTGFRPSKRLPSPAFRPASIYVNVNLVKLGSRRSSQVFASVFFLEIYPLMAYPCGAFFVRGGGGKAQARNGRRAGRCHEARAGLCFPSRRAGNFFPWGVLDCCYALRPYIVSTFSGVLVIGFGCCAAVFPMFCFFLAFPRSGICFCCSRKVGCSVWGLLRYGFPSVFFVGPVRGRRACSWNGWACARRGFPLGLFSRSAHQPPPAPMKKGVLLQSHPFSFC